MEIVNCGLCPTDGECLISQVNELPDIKTAKCDKIYRNNNGELYLKTDGGWSKLATNQRLEFSGKNGIKVVESSSDPETRHYIVDGSGVLNDVKSVRDELNEAVKSIREDMAKMLPNVSVPIPSVIFEGKRAANSFDFPDYDKYDYVEIEYNLGTSRGLSKFYINDLKAEDSHIVATNVRDGGNEGEIVEMFTKLVDGNKLSIEKNRLLIFSGSSIQYKTDDNESESGVVVEIRRITAYKMTKLGR